MYEVTVEQTFSAAHHLRDYKGPCEHQHGHNFKVRVTIQGERLNKAGMLVDFADVKTVMKSMGLAMMGTGVAEGDNRAVDAARRSR